MTIEFTDKRPEKIVTCLYTLFAEIHAPNPIKGPDLCQTKRPLSQVLPNLNEPPR